MIRALCIALLVVAPVCGDSLAFPFKLGLGSSREKVDPRDAAFTSFQADQPFAGLPWGKPLQGGPIRVLLIAPRFTLGDGVELARRLDVELETVALWDGSHVGRPEAFPRAIPGTSEAETLETLRGHLSKKRDLIIAANFDLSAIPEADWQAILAQVNGGTGLMLAHYRSALPPILDSFLRDQTPTHDVDIVTGGIGARLAPELREGLGFVQTSRHGSGRIVEFDYPGDRPHTHCLIPAISNPLAAEIEHLETYLSLVSRAVHWAAGRDDEVRIASIVPVEVARPDEQQVPPGLLGYIAEDARERINAQSFRPYEITLAEPAPRAYTVKVRLRQAGRSDLPVMSYTDELPKGGTTYRVYVFAGAGDYYLDVWLLERERSTSREKVATWHTEAITIEGWPRIDELIFSKPVLLTQDGLGVSFSTPARSRPCGVYVRATDPYGRVVAETSQRIGPDTSYIQTGLKVNDLIRGPLKVEVYAVDRDTEGFGDWDRYLSAFAYRYVPVRRTEGPYRLALAARAAGNAEYNARATYETLAGRGISELIVPGREDAVSFPARSGLGTIAEIATYAPASVSADGERTPCLSDPAFREAQSQHAASTMRAIQHLCPSAVSLGSMNALTYGSENVCQAEPTHSAFRVWLQSSYGSLQRLNGAWGTAFENWDAVMPPPEEASRSLHVYPPWVDFRMFMDSEFIKVHAEARASVRAVDPRVPVGFETTLTDTPYAGYEWHSLASQLDFVAVPATGIADRTRSFRGQDAFGAIAVSEEALAQRFDVLDRWLPWYAVFHAASSLMLPNPIGSRDDVPLEVLVGADGTAIEAESKLMSAVAEIQRGLDSLLLRATRVNSGVALYQSQASFHLNHIDDAFGAGSRQEESAFAAALTRLGYGFDYVSAEDAIRGGLAGYRVLILPMARALSDAEVTAIRAFHESGGSVVADVAPGQCDEHGVARAAPGLDGLFGISHGGPVAAGKPVNALVEYPSAERRASAEFAGIRVDGGVRTESMEVGGIAGVAPVWIVNRNPAFAVLLNHPVIGASAELSAEILTLLDVLLRDAGAVRAVDVQRTDGGYFDGETFAFRHGSVEVVALLASPQSGSQRIRINNADIRAVYDVRAGRREFRPREVSASLDAGDALVYARMPYEVRSIEIQSLNEVLPGNRLPIRVTLDVKGGEAIGHVVRVEIARLMTESAATIPYYTRDIVCDGVAGDTFVTLALNERSGPYKIVARDIATGASSETVFSVSLGPDDQKSSTSSES